MPPTWPDDEYLLLLGRTVYAVAALEGLLISDLTRLPQPPPQLAPIVLAGKTTTEIGHHILKHAGAVPDPSWTAYLRAGAGALVDLGPKRNAVLHARPASVAGEQRLNRWRPPETFPITPEHLAQLLDQIDEHRSEVDALRPGFA